MTLDELQKMILDGERGLVPVAVSQSPKSDLTFEGSLAEYLATIDVCASSKPMPILIEQFPFGQKTFLIEDPYAAMEEEALKVKAEEKRQQVGEAQNQRKAELLTKLRALADDPEFAALKAHRATQRVMKTYAFERIPGLEELGVDVIREEISLLSDKVALKRKG